MNKRRLLKLADLLEADAKNKKGIRFNMGNWGYVSDKTEPLSCGTSACAMGLAGLSGAFKRAGLETSTMNGGVRFQWRGAPMNGFDVAVHLFDIHIDDADILFSPTGTEGRNVGAAAERAKAQQIRKFVKTGALPTELGYPNV